MIVDLHKMYFNEINNYYLDYLIETNWKLKMFQSMR